MDTGPLRTCVGCRKKRPQQELVRVARGSDGEVSVGPGRPGRGAYLCPDPGCVDGALRTGRLRRALRSEGLAEGLRDLLMMEIGKGTDG